MALIRHQGRQGHFTAPLGAKGTQASEQGTYAGRRLAIMPVASAADATEGTQGLATGGLRASMRVWGPPGPLLGFGGTVLA